MRKTTILLLDDDPTYLATLAEVLERESYHVIPASDASEAIQAAAEQRIDLAILDLRLEREGAKRTSAA